MGLTMLQHRICLDLARGPECICCRLGRHITAWSITSNIRTFGDSREKKQGFQKRTSVNSAVCNVLCNTVTVVV